MALLRSLATLAICMALPAPAKPPLLRLLGHRVHRTARIRLSLIWRTRLWLAENTSVGSASLVACRRLVMRPGAYVGMLNIIRGPLSIQLAKRGALGTMNTVARNVGAASIGPARLALGELSKITSGHHIDCTSSIRFGDFSTLAGKHSHLWTHGYVHEHVGAGRYRVDGAIIVGNNVYIGSGTTITAGVTIGDAVSIGPMVCVTRDLLESGLYVAPAPIFVDRDSTARRANLEMLADAQSTELVYRRDSRPR